MNAAVKMYMCVVNREGESEVFTDVSYFDLIGKVMECIFDNYLDDYPSLSKFKKMNSVDFIEDYDAEEYRDILNKMVFVIEKDHVDISVKFIGVDQEIINGKLISVSQDTM